MTGTVRTYGAAPWRAAAIHGGPGAIGAAQGLAREAAAFGGVVEPLQSCDTIEALLAELREQLLPFGALTVLGHSWGAWLAALLAARFPELVTQLVLIDAGALDVKYVPRMVETRLAHLSPVERGRYHEILEQLEAGEAADKDACLAELGRLCDHADTCCRRQDMEPEEIRADGTMYAKVWEEAAEWRRSGGLLEVFRKIRCPIAVWHGDYDTTPVEAVTEPLRDAGVNFTVTLLPQCGHTPWHEVHGVTALREALRKIME